MNTEKIFFIASLAIFLTSAFVFAGAQICSAGLIDGEPYYLDSSKINTIELWTEDQPWWDTNWKQRQQIAINGTVRELTDYQIKIELNSENVGENWNWFNNGKDIRFTDDMNRKLGYFIETWKSSESKAKIWVKVPSIPLQGTTIYMYYKNTGAESESNGKATFVYFDNFDKYRNWEHFTMNSNEAMGSTIYDLTTFVSRPYSLKTALNVSAVSNTITEGAQSPAILLNLDNDQLIIDLRYKTSGTNWQNSKDVVSMRVSNFPIKSLDEINPWYACDAPIKYLPNSNNKWTNGSSKVFTLNSEIYNYLRLEVKGYPGTLTNVSIDDVRIRKYVEQEPNVVISNQYGFPEKKIIILDSTEKIGMLFNIGEQFEAMEQKKQDIEEIKQEEKEQEEIKAQEEEERKRREGFQMQETKPKISTQLYLINGQTLSYKIGGNTRGEYKIGGNTDLPMVIGGTGTTQKEPVSAPARQAIDTSRQASQGSKAAGKVATFGKESVKASVAKAGVLLVSAARAGMKGNLPQASASMREAAQAIAKAQKQMEITETAVEIENKFTNISEQATNTASYHIAEQISSGGYSQSFTQQEIRSAVNSAITQSQGGQVGEITLEKFIETEQDGKMVISGKEVFKVTVITKEQEINTISKAEISDDAQTTSILDMGGDIYSNCPFGCSKPEVVSRKGVEDIDDSNLFIRVEDEDDMQAITIDKVWEGGELHYEKIPVVIEKYTVEDEKEILVIKIGEITKDWLGDETTTVRKIEIDISKTTEGIEIELDDIPATDLNKPEPIVDIIKDKDYTPIDPSYAMTDTEKKLLAEKWADNQKFGHGMGFNKITDATKNNYEDYKNAKQEAINNGFEIVGETVDDNGNPSFKAIRATISKGNIFGKTEMRNVKLNTGEGNIPEVNKDLQYDVKDIGQTSVSLSDVITGNVSDYEFTASGANARLLTAEISGDELVFTPANIDKTYGTDYINVWATDKITGKTALTKVFITKGESNTQDLSIDSSGTFDATVSGERADKVVVHFEDFDIKIGDQLYVDGKRVKSVDDIPPWGPQDDEIYVDNNGYTTPFTPVNSEVTVEKRGSGSSTFDIDSVINIEKSPNAGQNFAMLISGGGRELGGNEEMNQIKDVLITDGGYEEDNVAVSEDTYKKDFDNAVSDLYNKIDAAENIGKVTLVFYNHGQIETMGGNIARNAESGDKGIIGLCVGGRGCDGMPPDPSMSSNDIKITSGQIAGIANNLVKKGAEDVIIIVAACHSGGDNGIGSFIEKDLSSEAKSRTTIVGMSPDGNDVAYGSNMQRVSENISSADGSMQEWDEADGPTNVVHSGGDGNVFVDSGFIEEEPSKDSDKAYTGASTNTGKPETVRIGG